MSALLRDAWRALRKYPGSSLLIVLAVALGTAANTAVFSVVDAVLFRPLPGREPDRLVRVFAAPPPGLSGVGGNSSFPVFADYRDEAHSFEALAGYDDSIPVHVSFSAAGSERLTAGLVTGSYFPLLGLEPALGRLLGPDDDRQKDAHSVVVLSHRLWQQRFGGGSAVIGESRRLNGRAFTTTEGRTREIGVRVALGACPPDVLRLVLGQSLGLAACGLVLGLAMALLSGRLLAGLLFGVGAADPWNLAAVAGVLALTAGLASQAPARRALRVDPVTALRSE
jgi:hypothetical protein